MRGSISAGFAVPRRAKSAFVLTPTLQKLVLIVGVLVAHCIFRANGANNLVSSQGTTVATLNGQEMEGLDAKCYGFKTIDLKGISLFQRPLPIATPGACCKACQERDSCVGWLFKACCNYCNLFTEVTDILECEEGDCVAGITDDVIRQRLTEEYDPIPYRRYRGLASNCEQKREAVDIGIVSHACSVVQRRCAPARSEIKRSEISKAGFNCSMLKDINIPGNDYNDGFINIKATPEDCCKDCLTDRGCLAWTRTSTGQCWKKFDIADNLTWEKIEGEYSGIKNVPAAQCGDRIEGMRYEVHDLDEGPFVENITNADDCCDVCVKNYSGCVLWSFFDGKCRVAFHFNGVRTNQQNAVTGSVHRVAETCGMEGSQESVPIDLARAYLPKCASILIKGPKEKKPGCQGRKDANKIFNDIVTNLQGNV